MTGYGVAGINFNPLGNLGLGMSGMYSSYDAYMPSMYGVNYGAYGMNAGGALNYATMNPYSMMGMYNPLYMSQLQNQMEINQLNHTGSMQQLLLDNEVKAHRATDSALIQKMLTDGDIQAGIGNLYDKVVQGDQDGICEEFDKLKDSIYTTYKDEFKARGDKIDPSKSAIRCIEALYSSIISQATGEPANLKDDIVRYGDNSFENGFQKGYRKGHHDKYYDETLNHCFGLRIDHKAQQDMNQNIGYGIGVGASALKKGAIGAVIGGTTWTAGNLAIKGLAGIAGKASKVPFGKKGLAIFAVLGAIAAAASDITWKLSKD